MCRIVCTLVFTLRRKVNRFQLQYNKVGWTNEWRYILW